ncbi:non-hydrolyzing UDP-N-acetylglucosamine 2-epimerase [Limosilactobacillus fastidiosus]|uniref:UDP-N-acetylglucosamine 2-epimerase (non-hydrolyzing) n=1 Tax=Limosilactobacillus fastidiosus TaxID=2759855 RepID=A0A7W3TZU8_9LACO|nr:UDP-N-acetylglucosamine 2-epimerase (non-hydrolyzing) [Limosilactobacillus fastidiosus]MBB1086045.1 UDP-N-acetylglucosamine 2-epimerase (non-hydrolyzing) [Limosilactobacillus fastidiosus]MCD7085614.1 UDP-N-acetylglucosamine 2-epimerase (non-hydrolyzing) [Limosilactobacillus fastidiosus]MCD7114178.1 UDP-N-acetylglucosamine 2-epimerase (non-hydrolyzing) [Limosilactobacillus fastidiosus]MCD7116688.1 UDP-N-acetylglucosamine 2-epimerase (non-hydrolyzing) [Limosilactobacillus fastidiosus]
MKKPFKIMLLFGTRAEAIKLAPIIEQMKREPDTWKPSIVIAAQQQRPLLQQTMDYLNLTADFDLDLSSLKNTNYAEQLSQLIHNLNNVINAGQPDMFLVVGDGVTSLAASLVSFYNRLPLGHVEAGLRTYDKYLPFPDEIHRQITDNLADLYFAPTTRARDNLLSEHHPAQQIYVTGNPVIDSVKERLSTDFYSDILKKIPDDHRMIILTMQRPESIGVPMERVFHTMKDIVETNKDVELIYPVYPNGEVMSLADEVLGNKERIHLIEPLNHGDFLNIAARCDFIVTDSGGIQEEALAIHKPVLLLREKTERQEAIDVGAVKIVGTDPTSIQQAVFSLLNDHKVYKKMDQAENPFGDGNASERILNIIEEYLSNK